MPFQSTSVPALLTARSLAEVPRLRDAVAAAMAEASYSPPDIVAVRLALEKALVNAIKHGHGGDPAKQVRLRYEVTAERVLAEVEDEGPGFDPAQVPDPLARDALGRDSGRGLLLIRHFMSWVRHNERGNVILLCKSRSAVEASERATAGRRTRRHAD
jgi:serine/threonine-protein kinase RsbW